ncbi:hypothetical protein FNF29_04288 [Cafeteria roenbergensis]|uniref:Uncharacterized protein n=1 Tax=Cafeteria roenbergensis TaxID=33653 RepID=A0A5A8CFR2_CAFRO|nr:hypothetical protein FNF29_04288 [Cafeteria roenbergensis]|eukprot:KAA0151882.1 hypothetical protein FNF29_04288 [Cafeteria roenbergensis]
MLGVAAALVAALAAAPAANAAHLMFKPDGHVLATDDVTEWDVTGFMPVESNRSLADPDIRYCMICDLHEITDECGAALRTHYNDICGPGVSPAAQQEAARRMGLVGPPKDWCDMQCEFEVTDHVFHTGDGHDLHTCMRTALDSCARVVHIDPHVQMLVRKGSLRRADVMMPHWLHALHHVERPHAEPKEDEPHEEFVLRAMDFDLAFAIDHRPHGQLPPAPPACTTCRQHGMQSVQCMNAARGMAQSMCMDGDELPVCAMGHVHCFPFPEAMAEVHEAQQREQIEMQKRHGVEPTPHEQRTWVTGSLGHECGMAVLDICTRGVVVPGSSIKTVSQQAQHHHHDRHGHPGPGRDGPPDVLPDVQMPRDEL